MSKKEKKGLTIVDLVVVAVSLIVLLIGGIAFGMAISSHTSQTHVAPSMTSQTSSSTISSTSSSSTTTSSSPSGVWG